MILYGYLSFIFYFALLFLGLGTLFKKLGGPLLSRKVIHILTGFSFFLYDYFFSCSFHQILICLAFLLIAVFSYKYHFIKTIESDGDNSLGTVYYALALLSIFTISYFVQELYPLVGFSIMALSCGDGAATLIGTYFKSKKIYHQKTLLGFLACIGFTFLALFLYNQFYTTLFSVLDLLLVSLIVGIFEEEQKGFDNITVVLSSFIGLLLLYRVEHSSYALLVFVLVFLPSFFCHLMSYHGSILAGIIGASFLHIAGIGALLYEISLYVILILIHLYKKKIHYKDTGIVKKTKSKDLFQVAANGLSSLVLLYLFVLLQKDGLLIASLLTFSNSFVDSVASDVGCLSRKEPYDFIRKEHVKPGTSGGISALGTIASYLASLLFSCAVYFLTTKDLRILLLGPCIMMICCFADTILGSLVQVKYKCPVCNLITEKEEHCGVRTEKIRGCSFFQNDSVNFLCSILCGILTSLIFSF